MIQRLGVLTIMFGAACASSGTNSAPSPAASTTGVSATAAFRDAAGNSVGTARLVDGNSGVVISGTVSGLGLGMHGIHVHTVGKCEASSTAPGVAPGPFMSAGGHFNPTNKKHGSLNPEGPHLGDLPNLTTPAAGPYQFSFVLAGTTLRGTNALLDADGAALVIHASQDDYKTDPSGNSGGRLACGVITAS